MIPKDATSQFSFDYNLNVPGGVTAESVPYLRGIKIPAVSLEPETITVAQRIASVSDYGYTLTEAQLSYLDASFKMFKANGGIPKMWHYGNISNNKNLVGASEDFSNAAWSKLDTTTITGTTTINTPAINDGVLQQITTGQSNANRKVHMSAVLSGTPGETIDLVIRDGAGGAGYTLRVTLTATPTRYTFNHTFAPGDNATAIAFYIRRLTGATATSFVATQIQCGLGDFTRYYARYNSTSIQSFNLGSAGALGDGTFVNGTSASMSDILPSGELVYKANRASNQYIQSSNLFGGDANTPVFLFAFCSRASTVNGSITGYGGASSPNALLRQYRDTSSPPQPVVTLDTNIINPFTSGDPGNNTWFSLAMTHPGGTGLMKAYSYGVENVSKISVSKADATSARVNPIHNGAGYMDGLATHMIYDDTLRTESEVNNIYNYFKNTVGL